MVACLALLGASALAQKLATVTGTVTDPSGALIQNASVHLLRSGTPGDELTTNTGADGAYTLSAKPGTYLLTVSAQGFSRFTSDPIPLAAARTLHLDVRLQIATTAEVVDATDDDNSMDTDPTHNGDAIVLKGKAIDELPLQSDQLLTQLKGMAGSANPDIYVDGFSGGQLPPRDTIREIRINQNPFSAQYDTNPTNGTVQIFTKPGTNKFHGYFGVSGNSSALNTRNPFVTQQPAYDSLAGWGNINGPLGKKTSFFANGFGNMFHTNSIVNAQALDSSNNQVRVNTALPSPTDGFNTSFRLDRSFGARSTVIARYSVNRSLQTNNGIGSLSLADQGYDSGNLVEQLQLSNSQIVTTKIVNDTRFQYTRTRTHQTPYSNAPTIYVSGAFIGGGNGIGRSNDNIDGYELQNYVSEAAGKHYFNYGGRFRATRDASHSLSNYNGTYTFASLVLSPTCAPLTTCNAYQSTLQQLTANPNTPFSTIQANGGGPSQFSITEGDPNVAVMVADGALFLQDDWKLRDNLTLSGGLRFETQNVIADHADWAPRFGFAWGIHQKKGKPPAFMLRGGAGLFYSRFNSASTLNAVRQDGIRQQQYVINQPTFYCDPARPAIPCGFTQAALAGSQVQRTTYRISPTFHAPYNIATSLSLERRIKTFGNITLTDNLTRGVHMQFTRNINAPLPGTYNPAVPGSGTRPLGGQNNIYEYDSGGVNLTNRLSLNYFLHFKQTNLYGYYQLLHATADTTGVFPSNQYNLAADQGRASYDMRHSAFFGGYSELPFGLSLYFYGQAHSGAPYNITTGQDNNGDSVFNDRPAFATDLTRASVVRTSLGNFDTSPIAGQTIIPINYGHGPGFFNVSLGLQRDFHFGPPIKPPAGSPAPRLKPGEKPHIDRRYTFGLGIEADNAFNQVNLAAPVAVLNSPLFGQFLSTASGGGNGSANRTVELNAYFHF